MSFEAEGGESSNAKNQKKHKGKHDKPKPWDEDPNIDRWKIEKFDPSWNEGGLLEVSSFSTQILFNNCLHLFSPDIPAVVAVKPGEVSCVYAL